MFIEFCRQSLNQHIYIFIVEFFLQPLNLHIYMYSLLNSFLFQSLNQHIFVFIVELCWNPTRVLFTFSGIHFFFIMTINRFQIISFTIEIHIYLKIIFPHRNQHSQLKCQCLYIPVSYGRCLRCYRKQLLICNITFNLNDGKVLCNF